MIRPWEKIQLRRNYGIPDSVALRFPNFNKRDVVSEKYLEVCLYENMFKVGLRLPFPALARDLLGAEWMEVFLVLLHFVDFCVGGR